MATFQGLYDFTYRQHHSIPRSSTWYNIHSSKIQEFCLEWICKIISSCGGKSISFSGKLILIFQILFAIPTYHLMYAHFSQISSEKIQRLYKEFLWGFTQEGTQNIPLISWDWIAQSWAQKGFGIKKICLEGISLMARWAFKLVLDGHSEWARVFMARLKGLGWIHQFSLRRYGYTMRDKLLFCSPKGFLNCNYTKGL